MENLYVSQTTSGKHKVTKANDFKFYTNSQRDISILVWQFY